MTAARITWWPWQEQFLRENYADARTADLAAVLRLPLKTVYAKAHTLGLRKTPELIAQLTRESTANPEHRSRTARFPPGNTPWNKGKPGSTGHHPNTARCHYTPGSVHGRAAQLVLPVGALRINSDGVLQRKTGTTPGPNHLRWTPVHRLVWEAAHGPVPDGQFVVFKTGRHTTELGAITPAALELVTRAENMRRNSYHNNLPPELARLVQLRGALTRQINKAAKADTTT